MSDCIYCGEAVNPDLEVLDGDDVTHVACRSTGCGFMFDVTEVDPDELRFGFSIVDLSIYGARL